jgi:hypothetical protein
VGTDGFRARAVSGFSADWLALREPLDAASRDAPIGRVARDALRRARGTSAVTDVIDLGAGTGANLRYVAPLLEGQQAWLLVDNDPALLTVATRRPTPVLPHHRCRVRSVHLDLATGLPSLPLRAGTLLTAAALLDLVSEAWLRALVRRATEEDAIVWFALTYDGHIDLHPAEPEDAELCEQVNLHQRTDKGFGPALGPEAAGLTQQLLKERGYRVHAAASDWRLGADQAALQYALLEGWCEAAIAIAPHRAVVFRGWLLRRRAHVAADRSSLRVGHVDIVGHP